MRELEQYVRDVHDFPKPGIVFKDLSPLLANAPAFALAIDALARMCDREGLRPDICAGPEARGFIFATTLAHRLGIGFVPIRKPGKLPSKTVSVEYALEYGTDTLEVHDDAFQSGQRVLLVDDVLATGGTMQACTELVRRSGAVTCATLFALELKFLGGRRRLDPVPVHSLLLYE